MGIFRGWLSGTPSLDSALNSVGLAAGALATVNELLAGSVGDAAQVLFGQPLDTVKTRAQIAPKDMFVRVLLIACVTVRKEGFFALYKAMASPFLGIAGVNSLFFASYAAARRAVSPFPTLSLPQTALAGAANAGQYGTAGDQRLRAVTREMWVIHEFPAYAGFYTAYEVSKRKFAPPTGEEGRHCRCGRCSRAGRRAGCVFVSPRFDQRRLHAFATNTERLSEGCAECYPASEAKAMLAARRARAGKARCGAVVLTYRPRAMLKDMLIYGCTPEVSTPLLLLRARVWNGRLIGRGGGQYPGGGEHVCCV
ncbi:hypothetical protein FB451DRAFT_1403414 [Mycena latifolia]|nr:hypothetical protein FB451DRAFT_1403414 [Mycena latifolia]